MFQDKRLDVPKQLLLILGDDSWGSALAIDRNKGHWTRTQFSPLPGFLHGLDIFSLVALVPVLVGKLLLKLLFLVLGQSVQHHL